MITATEPLEYFPRGRQVVENHPGPNVEDEHALSGHPVDFVLLHLLQNVNISLDEDEPVEFYRLRELPIETGRNNLPCREVPNPYLCKEEELYVRGHTAVWTHCMGNESHGLPQTTFTCDTPIKFAFFCPKRFIRPDTELPGKCRSDRDAICLIDKDRIHVFLDSGETYKAMLQCPVSAVWMIPEGIMLERNANHSVTVSREGVPWPRLFTLTFPLEEMKPVLLAIGSKFGFLDSPNYRVVFSSESVSLVLLYEELSGKHYVYKLRPADEAEIEMVECVDDNIADTELEADNSNLAPSEEGHESTTDHRQTPSKPLGSSAKLENTFGLNVSSWINSIPLSNNPLADQPTRTGEDVMFGMDRNCVVLEQPEAHGTSLAPQFCLEHVWTVDANRGSEVGGKSMPLWSSQDGEMASEGFLHTDLVGNKYICFIQSRACRLSLVQYNETNLNVVGSHMIPARSAISLDHINMIVVLESTGRLLLYSGPIAVGKLHVTGLQSDCFRANTAGSCQPPGRTSFIPVRTNRTSTATQGSASSGSTASLLEGFPRRSTLLPNVSVADGKFEEELHLLSPVRPVHQSGTVASGSRATYSSTTNVRTGTDASIMVKLRDATGSRFTLVLANDRLVRLALAPVAESQLVLSCLKVMRLSLPNTIVHIFLIHWYGTRNVPGSHAGFSAHQEWDLFCTLLFTMMGRPIGPPDVDDRVSAGGHQPAESGSCACTDEPKKRRRGENSHGQTADWEFLVRHATDQPYEDVPACTPPSKAGGSGGRPYQNHDLNSLYPYIPEILQMFHLLYEDLKMNVCRTDELRLLADFLYCLAADAKLEPYQLHYLTDFPELLDRYRRHDRCLIADSTMFKRLGAAQTAPPHIFRYIERMLGGLSDETTFPYRAGINDFSYDMLTLVGFIYRTTAADDWVQQHLETVLSSEFFVQQAARQLCLQPPLRTNPSDEMSDGKANTADNRFARTGDTVLAFLVERGYTRSQLDRVPITMRYIVLHFLEGCREYLIHGLQAVFYELLMRPELRAHSVCSGLQEWVPDQELNALDDLEQRYIAKPRYDEIDTWQREMSEIEICGTGSAGVAGGGAVGASTSGTGTSAQKEDTLRHGRDEDGMGGLDDEFLQLRFPDDRRMDDVRAFLNSSQRIQINIPQPANVPDHEFLEEQERRLYMLCMRTMALPIGRGMFTVCSSRPSETQTVPIPRLCLSGRDVVRGSTIEIQQIEVPANMSQWPAFHNGVAAGLRICPDTPHLTSTWIANNRQGVRNTMLAPGTDSSTEHGGFLMALGLTGHLGKLSVYSIFDYMVRSDEMVRLGLLLGLSAAHRGTGDLHTTRLLAVHVEALLPPTSVELDVSQNLQVAALLGVGLLYQGTAKRHMVEILLQEIGRPPGPEMENYVERESYSLTAGLALGLVTLGLGDNSFSLHDLALPDTLYYYMNGGNRRLMVGAQKEKYRLPSFQIKEGPAVNLDVTAPGATLALGLMYFATGNEAISRLLEPPTTNYILQFVRPDLLQLRTIARHLIHWDRIEPTSYWVDQQIPELLQQNVSPLDEMVEESAAEQQAGQMEKVLYAQAYCSVMCGSAMAIGLRFAGTADETAVKTLYYFLLYFIEQGNRLHKFTAEVPSKFARSVGRQMVENCSMVLLLSLSLVLAGTGDLRVLRAVRMLRSRIGVLQVTYGSHMAIHMALGFLFLGGGRFTLSRSPTAIAALVCTIFPKFPTYSNDNRYHLQAFRHLYVLAIEPRVFIPRSIDTGKLCMCRIRYALLGKDVPPVEQFAPCLLPEFDTLAWIEVCDENFWHIRFDRQYNWQILESIFKKNERVDVKQRTGCLSYQEDPTRLITSQIQTTSHNHSLWHFEPLKLLELVGQTEVINTTRMLLIPPDALKLRCLLEPTGSVDHERHYMSLYAHHVTDCVLGDRLHALPLYLGLTQILQDNPQRMYKAMDAWQLRLFTVALDRSYWPYKIPGSRSLLSGSLLQSLLKRIWKRYDEQFYRYRPIVRQYLGLDTINDPSEGLLPSDYQRAPDDGSDPARRREHLLNLTKLIVLYDMPYGTLLSGGRLPESV